MRNPKSPLLGLMWVDPAREDPLNNIRHEAQQRDGVFLATSVDLLHVWNQKYALPSILQ